MEFEDLVCITENMASKLRNAGINTVEALAMQTFNQLKQIFPKMPDDRIRHMQEEVWKTLGYWFTPASKLTELRKEELIFSTGCKALDKILAGGIRTRCITEFSGEYGAGKTESLLTILVETLGRNPNIQAIWFDTEESFKEIRVSEIAASRGYKPDKILAATIYVPIWHTDHFMTMIQKADSLIKNRNVRLILVDSITGPLRSEYLGREVLWLRQQILNRILRYLLNYAKAFNLAVVVTNQVVANPNAVFTFDPVQQQIPVGGNILAHNAETRIYLRKAARGNVRIARLIDSSWLPPAECIFMLTEKGIEDIPEEPKQKKGDLNE